MIDILKAFFSGEAETVPGHDPLQVAAAALLAEAATLDGTVDAAEEDTLRRLLRDHFDLDAAAAEALAEAGTEAAAESNELYTFTRTIKDRFDYDDRLKMIEMLWEMAYADGELHDFEASLVRRVAGLLYVHDRDSGTARKTVVSRLGLV